MPGKIRILKTSHAKWYKKGSSHPDHLQQVMVKDYPQWLKEADINQEDRDRGMDVFLLNVLVEAAKNLPPAKSIVLLHEHLTKEDVFCNNYKKYNRCSYIHNEQGEFKEHICPFYENCEKR